MSLTERFTKFIHHENLFRLHDRLLLAVSGGIDSVVLCELCQQAGFSFVIAHCNFQLRGGESSRDEAFVQSLGEKYGRPVLVKTFDTAAYAANEKLSVQVAARELRYKWFRELTQAVGEAATNAAAAAGKPRFIVTAHHADDNIETLLMNFFKGTGIAGLRGILPRQGNLVRPLLFARKPELLQFAQVHRLAHVEDSSNASDKYARNYFRHHLIPAIQKLYPQAEENLLMNLHRFRETEQLYRQSVDHHKRKLLEQKGAEIHIPILKWKKAVPLETITFEIIRDFGFSSQQVPEVVRLMDSISGSYIASEHYRIIRNRKWMIISPLSGAEAATFVLEPDDRALQLPAGVLHLQNRSAMAGYSTLPQVAELDADLIRYPLLVRKLKAGDYFYPLGMKKKKKAGRFLSDLKVSLPERENTWVVEMDKKIVWIVGRRIDDRFRITPSTKNILQLTIESSRT